MPRYVSTKTTTTTATAVVATIAATVLLLLRYRSKREQQRRRLLVRDDDDDDDGGSSPSSPLSAGDVRGNPYATGTDVVRRLHPNCPPKTFVITGTSSGLGRHLAELLLGSAQQHHTVIMGVRDPKQVEDLCREINDNNNGNGGDDSSPCKRARAYALDLSSLRSVRNFALEVIESLRRRDDGDDDDADDAGTAANANATKIDALIHNAGVFGVGGKTEDGYQTVWQVHALAPALLTELLLPHLNPDEGRVLYVSSEMHRLCFWGKVSEKCPPPPSSGDGAYAYALAKSCQNLHALALDRRFLRDAKRRRDRNTGGNSSSSGSNDSNVHRRPRRDRMRAFAAEPGMVRTNIGRHSPSWQARFQYDVFPGPLFLRSVDRGCATTLFCALAPPEDLLVRDDELEEEEEDDASSAHRCYYADCAPKTPNANSNDWRDAEALAELYRSILTDGGYLKERESIEE